jgi:hypothetical protein
MVLVSDIPAGGGKTENSVSVRNGDKLKIADFL